LAVTVALSAALIRKFVILNYLIVILRDEPSSRYEKLRLEKPRGFDLGVIGSRDECADWDNLRLRDFVGSAEESYNLLRLDSSRRS
jgi:hypothetical protein